jgi:hypothetical protein
VARRVLALILLGLALVVCVALAASESLTNRTGRTAIAVTVTFSEQVRITSYDETVLPTKEPSSRSETFRFSGGQLENGARFSVSWTPSTAEITSTEWETTTTASAPTLDVPVVTGDLLNPLYFAHGACVMQGIVERDQIFAMPLLGIPELAFTPTVKGIAPADVTWSVRVSSPTGVAAEIADGVLYIWGTTSSWSGYGEVVLAGETSGGLSGSVAIPVIVLRTDKTLTDATGKKSYFVPWSPQLDTNRILSTEEHMRKFSKPGLGLLDRTLRFSRWRAMEPWYGALISAFWPADLDLPASSCQRSAQYALVDVRLAELRELGFRTVTIHNYYWTTGLGGTSIREVYSDPPHSVGASKDREALRYFVNEAHRNGLRVIVSPCVLADNRPSPTLPIAEMGQATPTPAAAFWESYRLVVLELMTQWTSLGLDVASVSNDLENLGPQTMENTGLTDSMLSRLVAEARDRYSGPLIAYTSFFFGPRQLKDAAFLRAVDIVACEIYNPEGGKPLTLKNQPTADDLRQGWERRIGEYFQPLQLALNKPFVPHGTGCPSVLGADAWGESFAGRFPELWSVDRLDLQTQTRWYQAQFEAFALMDGYYGPCVYWYDFVQFGAGSVRDIGVNPRLKPVEDYFRLSFGSSAQPRSVSIDGNLSDWREEYAIGSDPAGDSRGPNDLTGLSFAEDDDYWYLKIDYVAPPVTPSICDMHFDLNGDGMGDLRLSMNNLWSAGKDWSGPSGLFLAQAPSLSQVGFADAIDSGSSIELRIAKRFLQGVPMSASLSVRVMHYNKDWGLQDETVWHPLPT